MASTDEAAEPAHQADHYSVTYAPHRKQAFGLEEIEAVGNTLHRGVLVNGEMTRRFEEKMAERFGMSHAMFVNSGSSANLLALIAAGVRPGDNVVTCALTFATTVAPILQLGAKPVYVDPASGLLVPSAADVNEAVRKSNARVVILADLVGQKPPWDDITDVIKVEDACDTVTECRGVDFVTTSFYASHVMTAGGTGGMVFCRDHEKLAHMRCLRDWGRAGSDAEAIEDRFRGQVDGIPYDHKFLYTEVGYNFKESEMAAAFGLAQLEKLEQRLGLRRCLIQRYCMKLQGTVYLSGVTAHALFDGQDVTNWLAMPIVSYHREELVRELDRNGIQVRVCFAGNITRHPAFRTDGCRKDLPNADFWMRHGLLVGAHHGMTVEDVDFVCNVLMDFLKTNTTIFPVI